MSVKSRACIQCSEPYFEDGNARCPQCDADSWKGIKGARERVLALRQSDQRRLAAQWQREDAERRLGLTNDHSRTMEPKR